MANRDWPFDLLGRATRGDVRPLDSADIREMEMTGRLVTDDADVSRWYRESLMSAEGECAFCIGLYFIAGSIGQSRLSAPILIADATISTEDSTRYTIELRDGTFRLFNPVIAMLLADSDDADTAALSVIIDEIAKHVPEQFPSPSRMARLFRTLHSRLPPDKRPIVESILGAVDLAPVTAAELVRRRESTPPRVLSTAVAVKFDALPDFSVERELTALIDSTATEQTAVGLVARKIGEGLSIESADSGHDAIPPDGDVLEVLTLSASQRSAIACAKTRRLTVVSGPPGTGKSHTIASLAINLAYSGKTVLVTSKTREAVSVVVDKLRERGGDYAVAHVGDREEQRMFATLLRGLLEYESLDVRDERRKVEDARRSLAQVRRERSDLSRAIARLEQYHAEFHRARTEINRLATVPAPAVLPELRELDVIRENAEWVREALSRPMPSMAHRVRSRALLNRAGRSLGVDCRVPPRLMIDSAIKAYYLALAERSGSDLRKHKDIRTLWEQHRDAVQREQERSTDLFNAVRRLAIATALRSDHDNTARLRAYAKSLDLTGKGASAKKKTALLKGADTQLLLQCFPVWAGTSTHLGQALHLEPSLFDCVIIDEASLCDPATAMPALFRGKTAVVVGDEKQLKHRTQLADARLQLAAQNASLSLADADEMGFRRSLFEIALSRASKSSMFMLDEHYRSLPPIIRFSNDEFYERRLKIMRRNPANENAQVVRFVCVDGRRNALRVIPEEFDAALRIVRELLSEVPRRTVGVITMTEDQARYMNARFAESLALAEIRSVAFKCGSPQSFQGDQRHTIILCIGLDADAHQRSLSHVLDNNRFNVAVTRAQDRMFVVTAIAETDFVENLRKYHEVVAGRTATVPQDIRSRFESKFEAQVYDALVAEGLSVEAQYESCGYRIDFVAHRGRQFVAIEVDGPKHFDAEGNYLPRDVERALRLMRGGWRIERVSCFEWESGLHARRAFLDRVRSALAGT